MDDQETWKTWRVRTPGGPGYLEDLEDQDARRTRSLGGPGYLEDLEDQVTLYSAV